MTFIEIITKYKKVILAGLTAVGLILLLSYVIMYVGNCRFQSKLEKAKTEVNTQLEEANKIDANIANLEIKKVEVQANVNAAIANLSIVQNEVNKAQENSNRAAGNVDNVNSRNYNGTSTDDAERKRCIAFPDSCN